MKQVSQNVFVEEGFAGCNVGFITTSEGIILVDSPMIPTEAVKWRETVLARGKVKYLINTELHTDHVFGNFFFPEATVVGHEGIRTRFPDLSRRFSARGQPYSARGDRLALREWVARDDPQGVDLIRDYVPRPPTIMYTGKMSLILGKHTLHLINMPGHCPEETTIVVDGEGVAFAGDNVVTDDHPFFQKGADPWGELDALAKIGQMDVDVVVPGHGAVCSKSRLPEVAAVVRAWIEAVEDAMRRGLRREEAIETISLLDRYPAEPEQLERERNVQRTNVANIWDLLLARGKR